MTEKRFTQKDEDDWEILDRNKHFAYAHSGYQAEKIIQELNELVETNRELYKENKELKKENAQFDILIKNNQLAYIDLEEENEQLKLQKPFLKIIDDYFIRYEDGEFFNLHKPSDIRSLMYILNREHGYSELQCEYNDLEKGDVE